MKLKKFTVDQHEGKALSLKQFNAQYIIPNQPAKFIGYASDWQALQRWNLSYLVQKIGETASIIAYKLPGT